MHNLLAALLLGLSLVSGPAAASSSSSSDDGSSKKEPEPCTLSSPRTGTYYDLRLMSVVLPEEGHEKKDSRNESWHARGYDYGANFTINLCAPVVEKLDDVVGVSRSDWGNISGFYVKDDKTYSIGQVSTEPIFRGRKLVMNFTDGSPCGDDAEEAESRRKRWGTSDENEDEDEDDSEKRPKKDSMRRKTTILSFLCDQEAAADPARPKVGISLVGWSPDHCHYDFEVRSHFACGGLAKAPDAVGPGGVFGIIVVIAISVYIFGGIAYQRTVMHQRGWRQLPNYAMWAGIASFVHDIFVILFSSCSRFVPRRRGYNQLPTQRGRGISREEENGLIDSLDEEWND